MEIRDHQCGCFFPLDDATGEMTYQLCKAGERLEAEMHNTAAELQFLPDMTQEMQAKVIQRSRTADEAFRAHWIGNPYKDIEIPAEPEDFGGDEDPRAMDPSYGY